MSDWDFSDACQACGAPGQRFNIEHAGTHFPPMTTPERPQTGWLHRQLERASQNVSEWPESLKRAAGVPMTNERPQTGEQQQWDDTLDALRAAEAILCPPCGEHGAAEALIYVRQAIALYAASTRRPGPR